MKHPHLDRLIYSVRERALADNQNLIVERLDHMSLQAKAENWELSTWLSIFAGIVNDMDREIEKRPK